MWPFRNTNKQELQDSEQALVRAQDELRRVKSRTNEVRQISGHLRSIREENHFADRLRMIMERG